MTKARLKQILTAKPTLALLGLGLMGLLFVQYRQFAQRRMLDSEINHLQQQQQALEQKNTELSQSLQYLTSADYKDRIARQQLGLKKSGEIIYSFGDEPASQGDASGRDGANHRPSNLEAWWQYLFHN